MTPVAHCCAGELGKHVQAVLKAGDKAAVAELHDVLCGAPSEVQPRDV